MPGTNITNAKSTTGLRAGDLKNLHDMVETLNDDGAHFNGYVTVENWKGDEVTAEVKYDRNDDEHFLTF